MAKESFTKVPNSLLDAQADLGLTSSEILYWIHARRYKYGERDLFVSHPTIAKKMGLTVRQIRRIAKAVEEKRLLQRYFRPGTSSQLELFDAPDPGLVCQGLRQTPDTGVRGGRTPMSGDPGHGCQPNKKKLRRRREEETLSASVSTIVDAYRKHIRQKARLTDAARRKIHTRLRMYTESELVEAIQAFSSDTWWMARNGHQGMAWFFKTDDQVERFLGLAEPVPVAPVCPTCGQTGEQLGDGRARCANGDVWRMEV